MIYYGNVLEMIYYENPLLMIYLKMYCKGLIMKRHHKLFTLRIQWNDFVLEFIVNT